jgi:hypothetical protein
VPKLFPCYDSIKAKKFLFAGPTRLGILNAGVALLQRISDRRLGRRDPRCCAEETSFRKITVSSTRRSTRRTTYLKRNEWHISLPGGCDGTFQKKSNVRFAAMVAVATLLVSIAAGASANAQYRGTPEMQQACTPDVMRLCNDYVPDVDKIVACMTRNRANLSQACGDIFGVGVSRRERKRN